MQEKSPKYDANLVAWCRSLYGPGQRWATGQELSRQTGKNRNTVSQLEGEGHATYEVLILLARAAGRPLLEGLVVAGHVTAAEAGLDDYRVTDSERSLVQEYRKLPAYGQELARGAIQGMLQSEESQAQSRQVAEGSPESQASPESR